MNVTIDPNDTILNLKSMIEKQHNISIDEQNIMFEYKQLMNEQRIRDCQIQNESKLTIILQSNDPLAVLLLKNNLYKDLYQPLKQNDYDLEMLQNDIKQTEIDAFCNNLGFDTAKLVKFRKLMRIISKNKSDSEIHENKANIDENEETKEEENSNLHQLQEIIQKEFERFKHRNSINITNNIQHNSSIQEKMEIALIGDTSVGKTSLIRRYTSNQFNIDVKETIGIAPTEYTETLADNSMITLKIWDTAGQERYLSICSGYYKRADVILICYDLNEKVTLDHCDDWREKVETYGKNQVFIILVACKGDLRGSMDDNYDDGRDGIKERAEEIIQQNEWKKFGAVYCECSAKTGDNVRNVFLTAAEMVAQRRKEKKSSIMSHSIPNPNTHLVLSDRMAPKRKKKISCCVVL